MQDSFRSISPLVEGNAFDGRLWTIPRESKSSLMILLTALGLAKCGPVLRTSLLGVFAADWFYWEYYDLFLVAAGMLLANLHHYFEPIAAIELPSTEAEEDQVAAVCPPRTRRYHSSFTHTSIFVFIICLLSLPDYDECAATSALGVSFFGMTLIRTSWHSHWGASRFWSCVSAAMLVAVVDHTGAKSWTRRIFRTRGAQYLGYISFLIYLVHGGLVHSFGEWLEGTMFRVIEMKGLCSMGWRLRRYMWFGSRWYFCSVMFLRCCCIGRLLPLARRLMP